MSTKPLQFNIHSISFTNNKLIKRDSMSEENQEQLEHCKAIFKSKYMGPEIMGSHNQRVVLTIKSVGNGTEKGSDGSNVEGRVIYFEETDAWVKPLWAGKHQLDLIIKAFTKKLGVDAKYHVKWYGEKVQLGILIESWYGKTDEYLRILPVLPVLTLPELSPSDSQAWTKAVNYIASGEGKIENILKRKIIKPENQIKLQADAAILKGGESE